MLEINQRCNLYPNVFAILSIDELRLILQRLSYKDIRALMDVNCWCRENIPNASRNPEACRSYRRIGPRKINHGSFNTLDVTAAKIECIPVVGYLISVPRAVGGLFSSMYYGTNVLIFGDPDSKRHAIRGVQNLKRGLLNSIPIIGEGIATGCNFLAGVESEHVTVVKLDQVRERNIEMIKHAIYILKWIEYTQQNVLPHIQADIPLCNCAEMKVLLLQEMEEWQVATASDSGMACKYFIRNRDVTYPLIKGLFEIVAQLKVIVEKEIFKSY